MDWTNISISVNSDYVSLWLNCYFQDKKQSFESYDMVDFREATYVAIGNDGMFNSRSNFAVSFALNYFTTKNESI